MKVQARTARRPGYLKKNRSRNIANIETMPNTSASAKPMNRSVRWPSAAEGLRNAPARNCPKMLPTPIAVAPMPMQARPAARYRAAVGSMSCSLFYLAATKPHGTALSMVRVKGVVEIDAGQNGEHISLQESHQRLERKECDRHRKRQGGKHEPNPRADERRDEAGEHRERDMAGEHIGEKTHGEAQRTQEERHQLDHDDERHQPPRRAGRSEKMQEAETVPPESVDDDDGEDEKRERGGHDDLARHREGIRNEADEVAKQNEGEERKDEGEELHALFARRLAHRVGDELINRLDRRLQPSRHERVAAHGKEGHAHK